jgi:hypothetical protein
MDSHAQILLLRKFSLRTNEDGSEDSICPYCFATVASSSSAQLAHDCWQRCDPETLPRKPAV